MHILRKTFSNENTCLLDVSGPTVASIFEQTIQHLVDCKLVAPGAKDEIVAGLLEREKVASTAIGHAVAIRDVPLLPRISSPGAGRRRDSRAGRNSAVGLTVIQCPIRLLNRTAKVATANAPSTRSRELP